MTQDHVQAYFLDKSLHDIETNTQEKMSALDIFWPREKT